MADRWMGVIELGLVFGLVLGLAIRELVKLRRDNAAAKRREAAAATSDAGVVADAARDAERA
jgi:hypothetical protein